MRTSFFASLIAAFMLLTPSLLVAQDSGELNDKEIRQLLIRQSIASYAGSCPCPYNVDRGGRRCGGRSAYSRPGGRSPICYESDVSEEMVARFRKRG